ncbi:MAG: hypothetical protein HY554_06695 [Elusimicrobia bacterium]|nr:hypothetical protein [Elusimicrobiota bacterium]
MTVLACGGAPDLSRLAPGDASRIVAATHEAALAVERSRRPYRMLLGSERAWDASAYRGAGDLAAAFVKALREEHSDPIWEPGGLSLWESMIPELCLYFLQKAVQTAEALAELSGEELWLDDPDHPVARCLLSGAAGRDIRIRPLGARWSVDSWRAGCRDLKRRTRSSAHLAVDLWRRRRTPEPGAAADLAFLCYWPRQWESLGPVLDAAAASGLRACVLLGHNGPAPALDAGIPVFRLGRVRGRDSFSSGVDFLRAWRPVAESRRLDDLLRWKGFSLLPLLRAPLREMVRYRLPLLERQLAAGAELLRGLRPGVLVTSDASHAPVRATCAAASRLGIPSLNVQWGLVGEITAETRFMVQDAVAAPGHLQAATIRALGVGPARIHVTGAPRYDGWKPDPQTRARVRRALDARPEEFVVTFFTEPPSLDSASSMDGMLTRAEARSTVEAVVRAAEGLEGVRLVVKPHPEEQGDEAYRRCSERLRTAMRAAARLSSHDVLQASDAAVLWSSATGVEAMLLGVPLVIFNLTGRWTLVPYADSGAALSARSADELRGLLARLAQDPGAAAAQSARQNARLEDWAFGSGRGAARRVLEVIVGLAPRLQDRLRPPIPAREEGVR